MALERLCVRARGASSPLSISGRRVSHRTFSSTIGSQASTSATPPVTAPASRPRSDEDIDFSSYTVAVPAADQVASFDPIARAKSREKRLPSSRYRTRPPRYRRGPLHPHQPPPASDPKSREFIPGPFTLPRLQQKYDTTLTSDLMAIYYEHVPPGTPKLPAQGQLRYWGDESPYMKNRPPRPPRGQPSGQIRLMRRQINWHNLPRLQSVHVSARITEAASDSKYLHAAGMALQAVTGSRAEVKMARKGTPSVYGGKKVFTQKEGKPIAVTVELKGESMWHFLSTLIDVVLPRIKEWPGLPGRVGDDNGNVNFKVDKSVVARWPEVEVNYDAYPPNMLPTMQVNMVTTCKDDKDMRIFAASLGLPFKSYPVSEK